MLLSTFVTEISPKNISQISVSWEKIRKTITWNSGVIWESFLTGSYIRSTKIDPIDDLDIFFNINFSNTQIELFNEWMKIFLTSEYDLHHLKDYCSYENWKFYVSPVKLINHIWKLVRVSYTTTDEQARNWECYTVRLSSYELTIDCVPCTWPIEDKYFLIPKWWNNLFWKKTNPKIDEKKIDELNNLYDWKLKWVIKIMKYWNKFKNTWVWYKSYILECLIYHAFVQKWNVSLWYLDLLKVTLSYIYDNVGGYCNIQDLPRYEYMYFTLNDDQKNRIKKRLEFFYSYLDISEESAVEYLKSN